MSFNNVNNISSTSKFANLIKNNTRVLFASLGFFSFSTISVEKYFVVERESSSVAIIENQQKTANIENLHDMSHAVVKFRGNDGYIITRDGFIIKINPITNKIITEYKTSKSAIGFVIGKHFVAVANYDDKSVDILSRDLKPIKKIKTNSKNVGIKIYKNYLIFSQMDNDKITVLKDLSEGAKEPNFKIFKEFDNVGALPFDAMIKDSDYIVGFFKSDFFGTVNLETMTYKKIDIFLDKSKEIVLKVPHFGFWSIGGDKVFVPAVGDSKVLVYNSKFDFIKNIKVKGLPVFTSLSPDKNYLIATFSGDNFPFIQIIDTNSLEVIKEIEFSGKVLHIRWSNEKPELYISVNTSNKVSVINTKTWEAKKDILEVKKPSGIFIFNQKK